MKEKTQRFISGFLGAIIGTLIGFVILILSISNADVYGNLADWVGGVGTLLAIIAAVLIADKTAKDNSEQAKKDRSANLYVDDLRKIIGFLTRINYDRNIDHLYKVAKFKFNPKEREEIRGYFVKNTGEFLEMRVAPEIQTIIYGMASEKRKNFQADLNIIMSELIKVMEMNVYSQTFDDREFIDRLNRTVQGYKNMGKTIEKEINDNSNFD